MLLIFDLDDTLYDCTSQMQRETGWEDVKSITLFPGARKFLASFRGRKVLVTRETDAGLQNRKIEVLGIRDFFDEIMICRSNDEKKECFRRAQELFPGEETAVIGDRLDVEIHQAREAGLKTIRMKRGKYRKLKPSSPDETPDYEIRNFSQLSRLLPEIFPVLQPAQPVKLQSQPVGQQGGIQQPRGFTSARPPQGELP